MKIEVIVDTNIISYRNNRHTFYELYRDFLADKTQMISFMTYYELRQGMIWRGWSSQRIEREQRIIAGYPIIYPDRKLCDICADIVLTRRKQPIDIQDAWIAATAIHQGCPLVTHNIADFVDIPGLDLYQSVRR